MKARHLPGFAAIENVEVTAVANRTPESAQRVADEFGIPRVLPDWRAVVDDADVDAVCIGTWPQLHAAATCAALDAGKHVLCEARMARNVAEAESMLAAAQRNSSVAMLVPSPFGLAGDRVMRRMIAAGYLGQVREITVRALSDVYLSSDVPLQWRQRSDLSGVNLLTLGILFETVQRWFGDVESVQAQTSNFRPRRVNPETGDLDDADIPDSVAVVARMRTGAQCVMHVSGQTAHGGPPRIEAFGEQGTLAYDLVRDEIRGAKCSARKLDEIPIPDEDRGGWRVEEEFVAAIREGEPVRFTNFADGLKYMRFTEAVRLAALGGERQAIRNF